MSTLYWGSSLDPGSTKLTLLCLKPAWTAGWLEYVPAINAIVAWTQGPTTVTFLNFTVDCRSESLLKVSDDGLD